MKLPAAALLFSLSSLSLAPLLHAQAAASPDSMQAMPPGDHSAKPPVPPSTSLAVTVAGKTTTFSLAALAALPQVTVHVHNAHANADEEYTGPLVSAVLAEAGLPAAHDTEPTILHSTLVAAATDHYFVVYSVAEVEGSFSRSQVIVALRKSGQPDTGGGNIQLINTDGAKPARWVHGLSSLTVTTLPPIH